MKKIGIVFLLALLFTACGKVNCPAYPESKLHWIPYENTSALTFANGTDTITFNFIKSTVSSSYSFSSNCDCSCEADAGFASDTNKVLNVDFGCWSYYDGESETHYQYDFTKYDASSPYYTALRDDEFDFDEDAKTVSSMTINGKIYKNVLELRVDTTSYDSTKIWSKVGVWKILVADSVGIIQFHDFYTHKTWTLVDD